MMKKAKKIFSLSLTAMMLFSVTACGGNGDESGATKINFYCEATLYHISEK